MNTRIQVYITALRATRIEASRPCMSLLVSVMFIGAGLLTGCDSPNLRVVVEGAEGADRLLLSIFHDGESVGMLQAPDTPRTLDNTETIDVALDDNLIAETLNVSLDALLDDELQGSADVTVVLEDAPRTEVRVGLNAPMWCGDGNVRSLHEECDDGNSASGDGCSDICVRESADAGTGADAGSVFDAGAEPDPDAGTVDDAGERMDAGTPRDAGDGGPQEDAGTLRDDGGALTDGGLRADAGVPMTDAGVATIDAGIPTNDAGIPTDYIAFWPLDDDAHDESGAMHDGTSSGDTYYGAGARGGAAFFDGLNDSIVVPPLSELAAGDQLTWAAWIRNDGALNPTNLFQASTGVIDFKAGTDADGAFFFDCGNGEDSYFRFLDWPTLHSGRWRHVAFVFDGTSPLAERGRFYIDGQNVEVANPIDFPSTHADLSSFPFYISGQSSGAFSGAIDDAYLYHRALTPGEIAAVSARGAPPVPNDFAHHWTFDKFPQDGVTSVVASVMTGASFVPDGKLGSAISLDGVGIVDHGGLAMFNQASQVSLAFFYRATTTEARTLFGTFLNAYADYGLFMNSAGEGYFHVTNNANSRDSRVFIEGLGDDINDGVWHHLAFVYDGTVTMFAGRVRVYVDGALRDSTVVNGPLPATTADLSGQPFEWGGGSGASADIDEAYLFDRPLSDAEVAIMAGAF